MKSRVNQGVTNQSWDWITLLTHDSLTNDSMQGRVLGQGVDVGGAPPMVMPAMPPNHWATSLMVTVPGGLGGKLHCQAGPGHYVL
jgi:hypothetical protein